MSKAESEVLGLIDDLIDRDMTPLVIQAMVRRHGYRVDIEWVRRRRAEREIAKPREVEPLASMQTEHEAAFRRVVARVGTLRARELVDQLEREEVPYVHG